MITSVIIIALALLGGFQAGKTVDTFWLKSSARVLSSSQSVRLTCRVPRSEDNRYMEIGIAGYSVSGFTLDGERAASTHERWFSHLPCGEQTAFCQVLGSTDVRWQTKLTILSDCGGDGTTDAP